jgi:PTH2 family peptidyl-tRNA hydrolase
MNPDDLRFDYRGTGPLQPQDDYHHHIKMVIAIRRDLKMRQGKAVAQGAHAAMMFMVDHGIDRIDLDPLEYQWFAEGMSKICVRVDSAEELTDIIAKAKSLGLKVFSITDAGRTEFHGVPTMTCCAIGPDYADRINEVTGHLKLL